MPGEADLITVSEAAARTGYTARHITRLLQRGVIAGRKYGPFWLTTLEAVEAYRRTEPKPGPRSGSRRQ